MSTTAPTPSPAPGAPRPAHQHPRAHAAPAKAVAAPVEAEAEEVLEEEVGGVSTGQIFNVMSSGLVSGVVHFVLIIVMAFMTLGPPPDNRTVMSVVAPPTETPEEIEQFKEEKIEINVDETQVSTVQSSVVSSMISETIPETPSVAMDVDAAPVAVELSDFGEETAPKNDLMATIGSFSGTGVSGRGEAMRGAMVARNGGNDASEAAVAAALLWFAQHQNPNGSWNFDHRTGPCQGRCGDGGRLTQCHTGATAMALLPFLGAGQTHKEGKYKDVVNRGLYFLASQMKVKNQGGMATGDLAQTGGSMYSHGLASIVLCEAYAMTHDKGLMGPAQLSLNHIVYAQDPVGGGWRYTPRQAGDTSAVGWQLMALKSGHMAYLQVPPGTIVGAVKFLDSVQTDSGARYGYTDPGGGAATSAVGLLCRMYLGWKKDHPGMQRGVEYLSKTGPSKSNMYFNYYATQVMRHYEGETWDKWNKVMRDQLVNSQEKNGHAKGSWFIKGDHGADAGGRIYVTSMSTMVLEVYYRHMPIYGKAAAEEEFPL